MAEVSNFVSILRIITSKEYVLEDFLVKVGRCGPWTHVQ